MLKQQQHDLEFYELEPPRIVSDRPHRELIRLLVPLEALGETLPIMAVLRLMRDYACTFINAASGGGASGLTVRIWTEDLKNASLDVLWNKEGENLVVIGPQWQVEGLKILVSQTMPVEDMHNINAMKKGWRLASEAWSYENSQ